MFKLYLFTNEGMSIRTFHSLDQAQSHVEATVGVNSFRVFQINGKKQSKKKEK